MAGKFAAKTSVTTERSKAEIEHLLERYGAEQFLYGWKEDSAVIGFRMNGRMIRFLLPLPRRDDKTFTEYHRGYAGTGYRTASAALELWEQACRQKWRALTLIVKAKLEAVESGITTFEDEFLAQTVLPDGGTFGQWARPQIDQMYLNGAMPPLLLTGADH